MKNNIIKSTTIIGIRKDNLVVIAGDGQASLGNTIMKANVKKIRKLGTNNSVVSGFAGRTTARQMIDATKIQAAADLYSSDFGDFKVIPNRFSREQTGYVIDPEFWSVAYLRDFKQEEVAKTGDAIKRALLVEYTLIAKNQAASGVVADLTTS